jgi:membrane-associated protein
LIDLIRRILHTLTDVEGMIRWGGYAGLAAIIFSETGLMVGFFLPGDSLLVAAGLFAARGTLNLFVLWALLVPMAILGNSTGYAIGRKLGRKLFARKSSRLFNHRHLVRTQLFYEQHGGKAVSFAQFLPIFRTFTPVVAGIATMRYRRFVAFNVLGAICWVLSMTVVGYALGRTFPQVAKRIELVMLVVIAVSLLPAAISSLRAYRAKQRSRASFLESIGALVQRLGSRAWDGGGDLAAFAAELPAPHGSRAVNGARPAVEVLAAQSTAARRAQRRRRRGGRVGDRGALYAGSRGPLRGLRRAARGGVAGAGSRRAALAADTHGDLVGTAGRRDPAAALRRGPPPAGAAHRARRLTVVLSTRTLGGQIESWRAAGRRRGSHASGR